MAQQVTGGLIQANGRIEGDHVTVASKFPGRVVHLAAREGAEVVKGSVLILEFDAEHPDAYRVLKMKHPKVADPADPKGRKVDDRSRIIYNDWITIESIPERAYNYELGSRSAVAWVMESNRVRTDKSSGIVNDPNDWAAEHDDPTYILDLVGRVVAVSMRTLDIVEGLPALDL